MLFPPRILAAVAGGTVDLAFRRWERPRVKPGGRQRTAIGVIAFDAVDIVSVGDLTTDGARRSGFASVDELLAFLGRRASGEIYRIRLRLVGPDPRVALRSSLPDDAEAERIERRLARLDHASPHGPWTRAVLEAIRDEPERRAGDLAAGLGRERLAFKLDVRKLKELGLTESLPIGYRLSPRGRAILDRMGGGLPGGPRPSRPGQQRGVQG